jgi:RNA polymerase sigma factor (sigma-70 family)
MRTEDSYFIKKCLEGDPTAFGFLVDKYKACVFALAYNKLRNFQDAEDAAQEVFLTAYRKLKTLKSYDCFRAWLHAITFNHCKMILRSQSNRPDREFMEDQAPEILDNPSIDYHRESMANEILDELSETINEALNSLPETYRQVLTLRYLGGMSNDEIAGFLGISPTAIRQRISRAHTELKEDMIKMMSMTFEQKKLTAGFTFRILEGAKQIKIQPIPLTKGLSLGLSLATGLILTVLGLNPFIHFDQFTFPANSPLPVEAQVLKIGEIPVDVVKTSNISVISSGVGKGNGGIPINPDSQNAFFMAPQGEDGTWVEKAGMPTARCGMAGAEVNGKIYVFSGGSSVFAGVKAVEEYDPAKDKWTKKNDMSEAIGFATACSLNGKIYFIGGAYPGGTTLDKVMEYDPVTEIWTQKASITPRYALSSCVLNGKIYAIGGEPSGGNPSNIVEEYDPNTDKWTRKKDMLFLRSGLTSQTINGKIYAIGGIYGATLATIEEYDPLADSWKTKTSMPTPRCYLSSVEVDGKIYVLGGWTGNAGLLATSVVEVYYPVTDTWEKKADMLTARSLFCAQAVNGIIYAIGGAEKYLGWTNPSVNVYSTVEAYDTGTSKQPTSISPQDKLPSTWGQRK